MLESNIVSFHDPVSKDRIINVLVRIDRRNITPWTDPATAGYDYQVTYSYLLRYPNHPNLWPDEGHEIISPLIRAAGHTATLFRAQLMSSGVLPHFVALFKEVGG